MLDYLLLQQRRVALKRQAVTDIYSRSSELGINEKRHEGKVSFFEGCPTALVRERRTILRVAGRRRKLAAYIVGYFSKM